MIKELVSTDLRPKKIYCPFFLKSVILKVMVQQAAVKALTGPVGGCASSFPRINISDNWKLVTVGVIDQMALLLEKNEEAREFEEKEEKGDKKDPERKREPRTKCIGFFFS